VNRKLSITEDTEAIKFGGMKFNATALPTVKPAIYAAWGQHSEVAFVVNFELREPTKYVVNTVKVK
jgi:hypothetical protein